MFIDTDIFYAYFSPEDWLHLQAKRFLEKVKKRKIKIETSTLVVLELEILIRRKNEKEAKKVLEKMKSFKNLEIVDVNKKIAEKAFEYQKKFDLGIFDSFHAATCFFLDKKIVSTDKIYDRIKEIKRLTPRNFSKLSTN